MKINVNRNELIKLKGCVKFTLTEPIIIQDEKDLNKILAKILTCRTEGGDNENTN